MDVNDVVAAKVEAARVRVQAAKRRREELSTARRLGLAARHAQKLRNLVAGVATPPACPGHGECERCDVTDPCPCCGLRYVAGRWVTPDGTEAVTAIHNPQVITLTPVDNPITIKET